MKKDSWKYIKEFGKTNKMIEAQLRKKSPKEITHEFIMEHKRAFEELAK